MKQRRSLTPLLFVLFASLSLAACGSGGTTSPKKKNDPSKDPKPLNPCPTSVPSNYHKVTVNFTKPLPSKIGLKLEGDADVRVSECADRSQTGPFASIQRNGNTLVIGVDHRGAYGTLPNDARFEVLDLQNCGPTSTSFFKQTGGLNITWRMEHPNGKECASRAYGEAQISPIGMEE